ncbi:Glutamate receptor ionotropic, kainate 1 [Nymphon striatum]|nr:Glutamate receptor ionotropic, kainate 1 [Nymphon striatum]
MNRSTCSPDYHWTVVKCIIRTKTLPTKTFLALTERGMEQFILECHPQYMPGRCLIKLMEVLRAPMSKKGHIMIRQGDPSNYREVLREFRKKQYYDIIIDTKPAHVHLLLREILRLQMNDYKYHYFFTSFDSETFELDDFLYNYVNMTAFKIVDTSSSFVQRILEEMDNYSYVHGKKILNKTNVIEAAPALMFDSVYALAHGLTAANEGAPVINPDNLSCREEVPWNAGSTLYNYINSVDFQGLTGRVQFKEGRRNNFKLDVMKLSQDSLIKVGEWNTSTGVRLVNEKVFYEGGPNVTLKIAILLVILRMKKKTVGSFGLSCGKIMQNIMNEMVQRREKVSFDFFSEKRHRILDSQPNSTGFAAKCSGKNVTPFLMIREGDNLTGNERYYGYGAELIEQIADVLGFKYELFEVEDKNYGMYNQETKEWNGLIRELIDKFGMRFTTFVGLRSVNVVMIAENADLALTALTITYAREEVVDFTKPFMNTGISILFKIPTESNSRLFTFMSPLAIDIWLYVLAAYVLVSMTMFVVARFSPYEWKNPHPCISENDVIENQFSLGNSFWFTIGKLEFFLSVRMFAYYCSSFHCFEKFI